MRRQARNPESVHNNRWSPANLGYWFYRNTVQRWVGSQLERISEPPVVIGALGGSGTRLLGQLLQREGFWMGAWVNPETRDAMATRYFLEHHFPRLLSIGDVPDVALDREFRRAIAAHRKGMPDPNGRWGWKNPRSMWIIPYLARQFPAMKFVHLVRDGRDMALSSNANLLHKHGDLLLPDRNWRVDPVAAQLDLWAHGNRRARGAGQMLLGEGYLMVRYEDLCSRPMEALSRVLDFLGIDRQHAEKDSDMVHPSAGIGRWRKDSNPALLDPAPDVAQALAEFGYR